MATRHLIVPSHAPGTEPGVAARARLERVSSGLRFLAAILILVFGPLLPNIGDLAVVTLGVFCIGYGLMVCVIWARSRTAADVEWAERLTVTADIGLVGFALLVFAPDPGWAVYSSGFVVIASGGIRFRNGALLAAASLSLTYTLVTIFRVTSLAIDVSAVQVGLQLGCYVIAGALMNAVLPELDALRQREADVYEPILQAQDDTGEALVLTECGRPVYWNKAFETLTGWSTEALEGIGTLSQMLIVGADVLTSECSAPARARLRSCDGRMLDVEVSRRHAPSGDDERAVWILRDITAREEATALLREHALHDALTGLPNRVLLDDRIASAVASAHRQHGPLCLLLIDLDGFKEVNDVLGHSAGDRVLVEVAKRIADALRESDTAARLGGDEFVVVLPATALTGAIETAWALNEVVARPIAIDENTRSVSASIGIATFPEHGRDAASLLAAADAAMYEAKRTRAGWRSYDQLSRPA